MTAAYAAEIVTWRYPPPYDLYDMTEDDAAPRFHATADGRSYEILTRSEGAAPL